MSMLDEHWAYASDSVRTDRFRKAIKQTVVDEGTVLDLGCGVGILGLLCLEAGAGGVIAIERTALAEVTSESLRRIGGSEGVEVIRASSYEVALAEPVDLIVCDHVGYFGIDYHIVALLKDARRRFLKPGGKIIPAGVTLHLGAVDSPACRDRAARWGRDEIPQSLRWLRHYDVNSRMAVRVAASELLAPPVCLDDLDFLREERDFFNWKATFEVARDGEMHGLVGWFDCRLAEGVHMTNSPLAEDRINRPQAFLPISEPLAVRAGDALEARIAMRPNESLIAWSVAHPASGKTFRHSTLESSLLDANDVRRTRPDHVPQLSERGKARQIVLGFCDGRRSVAEIEAAVLREHPDLMPSRQALSDFVLEVLGRDTE